MSLYLKYRPSTFDTVVGQTHVLDVLKAQISMGQLNHCYLFSWPRGTGKTTTARLLAKAVNIDGFVDGSGDAELIQLIDEGKSLDYVEIDAASHTWVDNIREEIIEKALYTPSALRKKVYVIDEVHMLSKGAFNALLKIMEEPPEYLMFVLATTEIHKIPDTIVSRCQVFNFRNHTIEDIVWYLTKISQKEWFSHDDEGLRMIAKLSQGWLRDAIKYLEQVSILWEVTAANVSTFLWVVSTQVLEEIVTTIQKKELTESVGLFGDLEQRGTDMWALLRDLLVYCDEHFLEDPGVYADLVGLFDGISRSLKGAALPMVMVKKGLYEWMNVANANPPQPLSTKGEQAMASAPSSVSTPVVKAAPEPAVATANPPQPSFIKEGADTDVDLISIKTQLVAWIEKKMVKSTIDKYGAIVSLDDGVATMAITQGQFLSMIDKPEIVSDLWSRIGAIVGSAVSVKLVKMTKEEVLERMMG